MKFLEPTKKPKVIYTDNFLEFGKACEEYPGIIVRQHHTDQKRMGLLKEQCAEWKKAPLLYSCNRVWMKNGGRIPWNAAAICETFKIFCLMARHPMKGGSDCHLTDQQYRLVQWSNVTLFLRCRDYINVAQKDCQVHSSIMYSGKETLWSQTLKNLTRWTHENSMPEGWMLRKC